MSALSLRSLLSGAAALLCVALLPAVVHAQVTIHLTTQQSASCDATTDAQGLRLVPNSTDLEASGVTLSGSGCGGGNTDFATTVTAPASVSTIPSTINVAWSAAATATQCTYGGTVGSTTGWPVGGSACSGASCAGAHSVPVTFNSAGSYTFSVTCTNSTGFAQGATAAGGGSGPPTPNPFTLTAPSSGSTGLPFSVSWSVSGATSCTGVADLDGNSATLPGWTDVTSPTSPRSVTPAVAGTYTLNLSCSNSNGTATSTPAVVVVSQSSGDSCPAGRQTVCDVGYSYGLGSSTIAHNADCTVADNIWGRVAPGDTPVAFPWVNYFAIITNLSKTGYIAAKFHAPNPLASSLTGFFTHGETLPGPNLTMSISQTCGDFNPDSLICLRSNIGPGSLLTKYKVPAASGVACSITPGQDYFINIKFTDPPASHPDCGSSSCKTTVQNNFSAN